MRLDPVRAIPIDSDRDVIIVERFDGAGEGMFKAFLREGGSVIGIGESASEAIESLADELQRLSDDVRDKVHD